MGELGRPTKLTPELTESFINCMVLGHTIDTCCKFVKITRACYYSWLKQGENEEEGLYRDFLDTINGAHVKAEIHLIKQIVRSDKWQAQAWIAERRYRNRWSKPKEAEEEKAPPIILNLNGMSIEDADKLLKMQKEKTDDDDD